MTEFDFDRVPGARVLASEIKPVRVFVPKLRAVDRIIASGHGAALIAALTADPITKLRFDAAVEIASDDADAIALLTSIDVDPNVILAP